MLRSPMTLLRPADPAGADALVRPATFDTQTDQGRLVRPTESEPGRGAGSVES